MIVTLALMATTIVRGRCYGKWTAEVEGRDGQKRTTTFNLKAEGDKAHRDMCPDGAAVRFNIEDGKINGDNI